MQIQLAAVFRLAGEQFPRTLADLRSMSGPVVAEGSALLPELLASHGVEADRAVWMVPTPGFQRYHYAQRPWARRLLTGLPDAAGAFETWMQRDSQFAADVSAQAREFGYRLGQQPTQDAGDTLPVHPMERLRKGRNAEPAVLIGQILGRSMNPIDVDDARIGGQSPTLGQHVGIGVHTDDVLEAWRKQQSQRTWPTPDVQHLPPTVELKHSGQTVSQLIRVWHAPLRVVGGATRVQRRIPFPTGIRHENQFLQTRARRT